MCTGGDGGRDRINNFFWRIKMAQVIQNSEGEWVLNIEWGVEDVRSCLELEDSQSLTDDDCVNILKLAAQAHDATMGMSWEVIQGVAFYYMAQKELGET
jgi:hypothetical protein